VGDLGKQPAIDKSGACHLGPQSFPASAPDYLISGHKPNDVRHVLADGKRSAQNLCIVKLQVRTASRRGLGVRFCCPPRVAKANILQLRSSGSSIPHHREYGTGCLRTTGCAKILQFHIFLLSDTSNLITAVQERCVTTGTAAGPRAEQEWSTHGHNFHTPIQYLWGCLTEMPFEIRFQGQVLSSGHDS
jgi:hypothetical protein